MGYSYGRTATGGSALACDNCGRVGGVRKRTCPHKVSSSSLRSADGKRHALPYCSPPAYCGDCFAAKGGAKAIHAGCAEGAAHYQARYDGEEAALQAGELLVTSAQGGRTDGQSTVTFQGLGGARATVLIPNAIYDARMSERKDKLSDYPEAVPA